VEIPFWISSRQKKPTFEQIIKIICPKLFTKVLAAIRMTDVGVAIFSLTRNKSVKIENEQMSTPEPENALQRPRRILMNYYAKILPPPTKPVISNKTAFHAQKSAIYNNLLIL
jgi:hypothetical protein